MILSAWLATAALAADPPVTPPDPAAPAAPPVSADPAAPAASGDPLSPYRIPFDELVERTIGTASKPVGFDWRRTKVGVAVTGDQLYELNNFNSLRVGGVARFPTGGLLVEVGASYVHTWDTPSSEQLALTPYRQPGRPTRMELDFAVGLPLAEGVVTLRPRFLPSAELVLNAYAGLRYCLYPGAFAGMKAGQVFGAVLAPSLTTSELDNLEDVRLDAMAVDPARYGLMVGLGNDLYFKQGVFLSPRVTFAIPVLAPVTQSDLLFWGDVSLAIGLAR